MTWSTAAGDLPRAPLLIGALLLLALLLRLRRRMLSGANRAARPDQASSALLAKFRARMAANPEALEQLRQRGMENPDSLEGIAFRMWHPQTMAEEDVPCRVNMRIDGEKGGCGSEPAVSPGQRGDGSCVTLFGISLGNGYYNATTIGATVKTLLRQAKTTERVAPFLLDDLAAKHTEPAKMLLRHGSESDAYRAEVERCGAKVAKQAAQCRRQAAAAAATAPDLERARFDNSVFYESLTAAGPDATPETHPAFAAELELINRAYATNATFHVDVDDLVSKVLFNGTAALKNAHDAAAVVDRARQLALPYALKELALFRAAPQLLHVDQCVLVYHDRAELFERAVAGAYEGLPRVDKVHLRVVRCVDRSAGADGGVDDSGVIPHPPGLEALRAEASQAPPDSLLGRLHALHHHGTATGTHK